MGEEVGDDAVLAGVHVQAGLTPAVPGSAEVIEQRAVVDGEERFALAFVGLDEWRPGGHQRLPDQLGAFGNLGARGADADPDLAAGPVQAMPVAPDDRHMTEASAGNRST